MPRPRRKPPRRAPSPKTTTIVNEVFEISPGKERHVRFRLKGDDVLTVTCSAKTKFYGALLARSEYTKRLGAAGPDTFQFEFGSDRPGYSERVKVNEDDDFYLVIRDGVFSPKAYVTVTVDLTRRGKVEPTIRSG